MSYSTHKPIRALGLIASASFWLLSTTVQAQNAMPMAASASAPMAGMQSGTMVSPDMKQSMKSGMDGMQKMQSTGDTDKDFASMMKVHHQQALDMAEMELMHGKSAELKAMAKKIISGQKKEIAQFDRWLAKQK
ncbi:MAG: DUF305 domain-containing protein [Burkholderiaceae bacterium]|nr:DUF305 domain-containing protein [Burkholderiaceae bacterium]